LGLTIDEVAIFSWQDLAQVALQLKFAFRLRSLIDYLPLYFQKQCHKI